MTDGTTPASRPPCPRCGKPTQEHTLTRWCVRCGWAKNKPQPNDGTLVGALLGLDKRLREARRGL